MGLTSAVERRASLEDPSVPLSNPAAWLVDWAGGGKTKAGANITEASALNLSAVYAAVRVLTDTVASIPLPIYERLERGKRRATEYPIYRLLHKRPNREMVAFTFKETLQGHLALWGNAYAEIEFNGAGFPIGLWPLLPDRTRAERRNGQKVIITRVGDVDEVLAADRVLHIPGFGFDGLMGYSPIKMARESLGLTRAAEEFGSAWFGNGSRPSGVLQTEGKLGDVAQKNLRESWERMHTGLSNAQRVAILEQGLKWQAIGIPPDDAQFLETRKFQTAEVARWFKVPPHMIGDLERSTNNNIEHQGLEFVIHTARPWFVRWEEWIGETLIPEADRERYFAEFLMEGLLRGDTAARGEFYTKLFQLGAVSPNDIREKENLGNPIDGGDQYFVQLNMVPLEQAAEAMQAQAEAAPPPARTEPEPEARRESETPVLNLAEYRAERSQNARRRHQNAQRRVFEEAAGRVVKREVDGVRRGLRKSFGARDAAAFSEFLTEFYESHGEAWVRAMVPGFLALAENIQAEIADETDTEAAMSEGLLDFVGEYETAFAERQVGSSLGQLQEILRDTSPDEIEAVIETRLAEWQEKRAGKVAEQESVQLGNAVARFAYLAAGVTLFRWVANSGACPLCRRLDGKVVGSEESFAEPGDVVEPDGEGPDGETPEPLTVHRKTLHPQLHRGCSCLIAAA